MNITEFLESKKPLIDREIEKVVPREISGKWVELMTGKPQYAHDSGALTKGLSEPVWSLLDRGGKRWRPSLTLLACGAAGGKEEDALPFTPLPELMHNGTLIVDDIEDGATQRRGEDAVHLIFGNDIAINAGNSIYFLPLVLLYRNLQNIDSKKRLQVYDLYGEEMVRVSFGQAQDIVWHNGLAENINEEKYLQMCVFKTGVLARFSSRLGAIIGSAPDDIVSAFGRFGESIGIGFQIQDDILNLQPVSQKWGKHIGEDISEGKQTLLTIHALEKSGEHEKLAKILESHTKKEDDIGEAIRIITDSGAIEYAQKRSGEIVESAWKDLEKMLPESDYKKLLREFAVFCVKREF